MANEIETMTRQKLTLQDIRTLPTTTRIDIVYPHDNGPWPYHLIQSFFPGEIKALSTAMHPHMHRLDLMDVGVNADQVHVYLGWESSANHESIGQRRGTMPPFPIDFGSSANCQIRYDSFRLF